jgi:hypothetical protein
MARSLSSKLCLSLKRGHYSRGDIIQGRTLFMEIWNSRDLKKKSLMKCGSSKSA